MPIPIATPSTTPPDGRAEKLRAVLAPWNAEIALAHLQAGAKRYAGMDNARHLIGRVREIRGLRRLQINLLDEQAGRIEQERRKSAGEHEKIEENPESGDLLEIPA